MSHKSSSRVTYAHGALRAAPLPGRQAGRAVRHAGRAGPQSLIGHAGI
ncbi:hypothetical protein LP420_23715 [Massilia sp. B-10]|nr:hypothetical protein LP420_23715 [Massilia sp. B-10]